MSGAGFDRLQEIVDNGCMFFAGSAAPGDSLGNNGDGYFRFSTLEVYKKSSGAWGSGSPLGGGGPAGPQGPPGPAGADGADGADGNSVLSGAGAPASGTGVNGDFYIDTTDWDIYGPKTAGAWGSGTSLIGPQGPPGSGGGGGNSYFPSGW